MSSPDTIVNLYQHYYTDNVDSCAHYRGRNWIFGSKYFDTGIFEQKKNLTIVNNVNLINSMYDEYGIIQMRPLNNETQLLLGCGNTPLCDIWSNEEHSHRKCYTIDPNIGMNPSIIGAFGINDMTFLPFEHFDTILFEGFMLECDNAKGKTRKTKNKRTIQDILYLLKENGKIKCEDARDFFVKKNNKLYHSSDDNIVISSDEDYSLFYNCC